MAKEFSATFQTILLRTSGNRALPAPSGYLNPWEQVLLLEFLGNTKTGREPAVDLMEQAANLTELCQ